MEATSPAIPRSFANAVREEIKREAPQRERHIAVFMAALFGFVAAASTATVPVLGYRTALPLTALALLGVGYYAMLIVVIRRGVFHPAMSWINVAIEVSAPASLFLVDTFREGPIYAMSAPALAVWSVLVMASSLRANRVLAYAAGSLAAVEFLLIYFLAIHPSLPADYPRSMTPLFAVLRAFFLFYAGAATAAVAGMLLQKSEDAVRNLRERDLMGKYLLLDRLGAGGMAEVFRARYCPEGGFERTVAVKRVLPAYAQNPEFVKLFREEARLGALLNHPNIVQVLDVGSHQGSYYLAMEFVDGVPLDTLLRLQGALPLPVVTYLGLQLAAGLDYAHHRTTPTGEPLKLVHRDLNPPNVLVSRIGEVKLSDFGIARAADRVRVTQTGMVRGKASYMSPEQAVNGEIDARTDLFALGLTLWEALTGRQAVAGAKDEQVLQFLVTTDVPAPSTVRPDVPAEVDLLFAGLLRRRCDERTPTARAVYEQFEELKGPAAPLPEGKRLLAELVSRALGGDKTRKLDAGASPEAETEVIGGTPIQDKTGPMLTKK
ncbi:MAG TPA: serine/threonine-protein kinase [Myxococcales bacterium]|jgi:serine/threonine-protein kinase